jgi:hypothetical protein
MYKEKIYKIQYKIDIIRIIIPNMFILYVLDFIEFYSFTTIFGQILSSLTLTKPRMQGNLGQRENGRWILIFQGFYRSG